MFKSRKILFTLTAMIIVSLACNLPNVQIEGSQPSINTPDYVATITAQASLIIQPLPSSPPVPAEITATSALPAQIPSTDTPAPTSTITLTPSPSVPMLSVSADTICRSGPSKFYDYLGALLVGENAEIVGKNTDTNYWIIKNPDAAGTCWLWGRYAIVTGNIDSLQKYTIPPTPTLAPPAAPKNLTANKTCLFNGVTYALGGSISWGDVENEEGYTIYAGGVLFGDVGADTTTLQMPPAILAPGASYTISVEAYNAAGKSAKKSVTVVCP